MLPNDSPLPAVGGLFMGVVGGGGGRGGGGGGG